MRSVIALLGFIKSFIGRFSLYCAVLYLLFPVAAIERSLLQEKKERNRDREVAPTKRRREITRYVSFACPNNSANRSAKRSWLSSSGA
jgi:hypothetical protein